MFDFFRKKSVAPDDHPKAVGAFYNQHHDAFIRVYGEVIQAFRTNDLSRILDYQQELIGLKAGQKVLDAGCGVCGPARYFAKNANCKIEAVTISEVQARVAKEKNEAAGLTELIHVQYADYHQLPSLFAAESFERIYFLESFGHSRNKALLLDACWKVLQPGGEIYIKDLFVRVAADHGVQKKINREIDKINEAYHYEVADLNQFLDLARKAGYVVAFVKTIDISLEDFENLSISNEFQELTGIAKIDNWESYVFPVDFFEIKLYKPEYDIAKGMHRYFIQNLFQIKVAGTRPDAL
ncbi:MAG: class I SAM-dependent methyltransferase [Chitinophagales bacterium]